MKKLVAPMAYQGGKQRISSDIIDIIQPPINKKFYDLCCGSGAISIELVNRGYDVKKITMLDKSPWGLFWKMVGDGTFDLSIFRKYIDSLPNDLSLIRNHLNELSSNHVVSSDTIYIFLLLQAGSFGGKAIWIVDGKFKTHGFRNYWKPTFESNRRHPVNPMMPLPDSLFDRVEQLCERMVGVNGICSDINNFMPERDGLVYIDPPYEGTTFYGCTFDVMQYIQKIECKCYVSESKSISDKSYLISTGRKKGGISGGIRSSPNQEWLSEF